MFSLALLFSAALVGGCAQDESSQRQPAAVEDIQQQADKQLNSPTIDVADEELNASSLANPDRAQQGAAQFGMIDVATADIKPASGSGVKGSVGFKPGPERKLMQVEIQLSGLEGDEHAIHIHEIGDCSAADAASAGGHFNPYSASHGAPGAEDHHVGDMGNITADAQGRVDTTLSFDFLAFSGPANILDKAVVVHAGVDDLETDPTGDAGGRVGCGVILAERDMLAPQQ